MIDAPLKIRNCVTQFHSLGVLMSYPGLITSNNRKTINYLKTYSIKYKIIIVDFTISMAFHLGNCIFQLDKSVSLIVN